MTKVLLLQNLSFKLKRMILILSTPDDFDTNRVVEWLNYKKISFFRLNDEDLMKGTTRIDCNVKDVILDNSCIKINLNQVKIVWFRKFGFLNDFENKIGKNTDLLRYIYSEFVSLSTFLMDLLADRKWLYNKNISVSKIEQLRKAEICGIKIPNTIICTKKHDLENFFFKNNQSIITKSLKDAKYIRFKEYGFMFHTHKIDSIKSFETSFSPSLFQEHIEKIIEIRTFYLDKKCYSMAIFSQSNERTKLDFRDYDVEKPNRFVPYKLPGELEEKIINFMNSIQLNTGSLDLIKSAKDKDYYFLEVNPCGQFGMTGNPCNYNLHEKVANYLGRALDEN